MARLRPGLTRAFTDLLDAAAHAGADVLLCGGLARNIYLRPRTTDDADFLVRSLEDTRAIMAGSDAFEPTEPDLVTRLVHRATGAKVDLIVAEYPFEHEAFDSARTERVRRRSVRVIAAEHLVAMKVDAAADPSRPLDFAECVLLLLGGAADAAKVSAIVRRDLPSCIPTLESILRAVERAKSAPPRPPRGRYRKPEGG